MKNNYKNKKGSALIVSLFTLIVLSLIIGSLALDANIESRLLSIKKKKFYSKILSKSGIEYSKALIENQNNANQIEIESMDLYQKDFMEKALFIKRGLLTTDTIVITNMGSIYLTIHPVENSRNINLLERNQWKDIFIMANIPTTDHDNLIDCLYDWIDQNDLQQLNGAESDDPYYIERGYPVKNAHLTSIEELLLIKNWNEDILYGKNADEESDMIYGIADLLTVWGDGKVNLNTASTNLLLSYSEYEEWELDGVMTSRKGLDGIINTLDDGIKSLDDVNADPNKFKLDKNLVKVISVGEVDQTKYKIECIMQLEGSSPYIVYWNEKSINEN